MKKFRSTQAAILVLNWVKQFFSVSVVNPLIKFVRLLKEIYKFPECQILWKLEHISILWLKLPESIILVQDYQFQVLYS